MSIILLGSLSYCSKRTTQDIKMVNKAFDTQQIISLFSLTPLGITNNVALYLDQAQQKIDAIIALNDNERTFANTAKELDELVSLSNCAIAQRVYEALELLSPNKDIRDAAHDAYIRIQQFWVDQVSTNKKLYNAFMAYTSEQKENEHLSDQQRYFLNDTISSFKREGLSLPDATLAKVKALKNELSSLTADFDRNIAQDNRSITVMREQLQGLDADFINTFARTEDGSYVLGVDYPTYFRVMENCTSTDTRKKLYTAFNNRAYPVNHDLLMQVMTKRGELAQLLGYHDFSYCDIDDQMAHTPERARTFIADLAERCLPKVMEEKALLTRDVPVSVI